MKLRVILLLLLWFRVYHGAHGVDTDDDSVSVMEGDSVTLHTGVEITQHHRVRWYFNDTRVAQITGDQRKICTDRQCEERFRHRLKMNNHTGDLTITNIRPGDSGVYKLHVIRRRFTEKIFNVPVRDVPVAQRDEMKMKMKMKMKSVKEGETVTLHPGVEKSPNDSLVWFYNDIPIAELIGDQSEICTDDQCEERFRHRLSLDHQTGDLTIRNIRPEDGGDYTLKINIYIHRHRISTSRRKIFSITISGSGSWIFIVGLCVIGVILGVLLMAGFVALRKNSCYRKAGTSEV